MKINTEDRVAGGCRGLWLLDVKSVTSWHALHEQAHEGPLDVRNLCLRHSAPFMFSLYRHPPYLQAALASTGPWL
jgi:hypothetical protein